MADIHTSAYDALSLLSVDEIIEAPELFEAAIKELIEGEQAYKLIFNTFNTTESVVKYKEEVAPELDDGLQIVPEFSEIPVTDPYDDREEKFISIEPHAVGIRVSQQQRKANKSNEVQREVMARARTIRKGNGLAALAALKAADIEEYRVETPWDVSSADVREDIGLVTDLIMGATDKNGNQFGYEPDVFWANPVTINRAKRNETVRKDFIGDMASQNPLFKKIGQNPLIGGYLQVVPDSSIPVGEAYIGVEGAGGYEAQNGAPTTTAFYEEGGQSGLGGPTMSWRSDYVHFRGLYLPGTKSIIKLTNLATA